MSDIKLRNAEVFAEELIKYYCEQGFQSISKRDLDLLIFILLEKDGAIDRTATNFDVARQLRLNQSKVALLRRDSCARAPTGLKVSTLRGLPSSSVPALRGFQILDNGRPP